MRDAIAGLATGEIARASRDATVDGIDVREGEWLGLVDGAAVASGDDFGEVVDAVVGALLDGGPRAAHRFSRATSAPDVDALRERLTSGAPERRGRGARGRAAALPAAALRGVAAVAALPGRRPSQCGYCSSTTATSTARRWSSSSTASPGSRWWPSAADSDAALRACRELEVDLVLLDYRLPDADGTGVTVAAPRRAPGRDSRVPHGRGVAGRACSASSRPVRPRWSRRATWGSPADDPGRRLIASRLGESRRRNRGAG